MRTKRYLYNLARLLWYDEYRVLHISIMMHRHKAIAKGKKVWLKFIAKR